MHPAMGCIEHGDRLGINRSVDPTTMRMPRKSLELPSRKGSPDRSAFGLWNSRGTRACGSGMTLMRSAIRRFSVCGVPELQQTSAATGNWPPKPGVRVRLVSGVIGSESLSDVQARCDDLSYPAPDSDWPAEARIAADLGCSS